MHIRFWGVRGSLPSALLPYIIREKISAVLEYVMPEDVANNESKGRFLDGLPPWLCETVGGNTPCISVNIEGMEETFIFDCGSGMRELGSVCVSEYPMPSNFHVFFSHFHWDHLQGLPFFYPIYNKSVIVNFYSPKKNLEEIIGGQMNPPYFPVQLEQTASQKMYHELKGPVSVGPVSVAFRRMNHPGDSYSYMVAHNGKRFIYATDTELSALDFSKTDENISFFENADMIVLDAQYTLGEAIEKYNWGHSSFSLSVDFAASWGIKHLVLFHFDPAYDDRKIHGMLQSARWYLQRMNLKGMQISLATEGLEFLL